jgi:hypothetical protein
LWQIPAHSLADLIQERQMDAVVIGVIIALAGTLLVIGYLGYRFFRIIMSSDDKAD